MHKYIKKNKEFKYVLFLLLFLSDAIKNDSPQKKKKRNERRKEIYDARHDFQFPPGSQMDTHKLRMFYGKIENHNKFKLKGDEKQNIKKRRGKKKKGGKKKKQQQKFYKEENGRSLPT